MGGWQRALLQDAACEMQDASAVTWAVRVCNAAGIEQPLPSLIGKHEWLQLQCSAS